MDDIIKDAMDRFGESRDGTRDNRANAEEDIRFGRLGDQWPVDIRDQRRGEGRPCLTVNRMPSFVRQVVNDARQNKPGIVVSPVDNVSDPEKAEVIGGIVRSIERNSNADIAYDTAIDNAVSCGFGFWEIETDYIDGNSFDQEIRISRIHNPLSVHWDVRSTMFDASDWEYAFKSEMISKDKFEKDYPDAMVVPFESDEHEEQEYWITNDQMRIASYYLVEETADTLLLIHDVMQPNVPPATILKSELDDNPEIKAALEMGFFQVTRERKTTRRKVVRRVISGHEVLEEHEWPGTMIPICPVWGEEVVVDGRRVFRSMIRDARDPQQMLNFWRSATTELVALAPKAPWVGPKGFVPKGHEAKWQSANTKSLAYLEYEGQIPPQRQPFAGPPAGAIQEALTAADDMKSIIGIYDSALGARSNETSGRAIMARQREADVSNFHFIDNLSRAIRYCARCIVEIIPHVYGQRETLRILGEDMKEKVVRLGKDNNAQGEDRIYDLSVGKYDVTVKSGPSYATQREETREVLIELMRAVPQAAPYMMDIIMEHLDAQGMDRVANRLKMTLPPHIRMAENEQALKGLPPELKGVFAQMQGTIKQLQGELQKARGDSAFKAQELKIKGAKAASDMKINEREMQLKEQEFAADQYKEAANFIVTQNQEF